MQEPIISPWLIYLANVPQALTLVLVVTVLVCVVIAGVAVFFRCMAKDEAKTLNRNAWISPDNPPKNGLEQWYAEEYGCDGDGLS